MTAKDDTLLTSLSEQIQSSWIPDKLTGAAHLTATNMLGVLRRNLDELQSDTFLLRGVPSSGKTAALNWALRELQNSHAKRTYILVKLPGIVYGHDCQGALSALISRIYSSLPHKIRQKVSRFSSTSFEINIVYFGNLLKRLKDFNTSVILVLDQIESYLVRDRATSRDQMQKQVFLYSLLELLSNEVSLIIIGVSSHMRIMDLFEKRLRSRMSQQCFPFYMLESFEKLLECLKTRLLIADEESATVQAWNAKIQAYFTPISTTMATTMPRNSRPFLDLLKQHYDIYNDVPHFLKLIHLVLALMQSSSRMEFKYIHWKKASALFFPDPRELLAQNLSILQLLLIRAALNMQARMGSTRVHIFNFLMLYEAYSNLSRESTLGSDSSRLTLVKQITPAVARKSFEELIDLRFFLPADHHHNRGDGILSSKDYRLYYLDPTTQSSQFFSK